MIMRMHMVIFRLADCTAFAAQRSTCIVTPFCALHPFLCTAINLSILTRKLLRMAMEAHDMDNMGNNNITTGLLRAPIFSFGNCSLLQTQIDPAQLPQ